MQNNLLNNSCIYCGKTDRLSKALYPHNYWLCWDYINKKGCKENKNNISPSGDKI
jgi:hypothetical protein